MTDLIHQTLAQLAAGLAAKKMSSVELTEAILARAEQTADLNAYVHLDKEGALAAAARSDGRRAKGWALGPVDGIPMGIKDIFATQGQPTTCASRMLQGYVAPFDAHVVAKLKGAGAVLTGKLNMDEFAMGSSNEHSFYGPVKNPWDKTRVPGGSSGGSAAAVAAGSSVAALGTDTGGSIRQPAAMTGTVGLKPTYGRVSRRGVIAYASSLDQVGPMTRDVTDCAILLQAIAGHDPLDATSSLVPVPDYLASLKQDVRGLRIGVPKEYFAEGMDPEVNKAVMAALEVLTQQGATTREVSLPHTSHGIATYYVLAPAEASSNLARFDGVRFGQRDLSAESLAEMYTRTRTEGFGSEVKRRIMLGTWLLSAGHYDAYFLQAQKVRSLVCRDFKHAFNDVDLLLTPTTPAAAFAIGANDNDPVTMYLADVYTVSANLAGLPGISVPCGMTSKKLPIGLQLLGRPFDEATLLRTAHAFEQATSWHEMRAPK